MSFGLSIKKLFAGSICLMFLSAGCTEELKNDDGPRVAGDIIRNSICYKLNANQIKNLNQGEFSLAARSMSLFNAPSEIVEVHYLESLSREDTDCELSDSQTVPCTKHIVLEAIKDVKTGHEDHFEREIYLPIVESINALVEKSSENNFDVDLMDMTIDNDFCYLTEEMYESVDIQMSFHNFSEKSYQIDPPAAVKESENCGGIENCKLNIRYYKFDQVFITPSDRYRRHFTFEISDNAPYLSRMMKKCITHSVPMHIDDNENGEIDEGEIRVIPIHECREVVNFKVSDLAT